MSFPARFASTCSRCEERIHEGDQITSSHDDFNSLVYVHVECPATTPTRQAETCTTCFLEKPCPCEDDQ